MFVYFWFEQKNYKKQIISSRVMVKIIGKIPIQQSAENKVTEDLKIEEFAWDSQFYKQSPKKITASNLMIGFWEMQGKGKNSLRNWAIESGMLLDEAISISKQAIDIRLNDNCLKMSKLVLSSALNLKYFEAKEKLENSKELEEVYSLFNRILLQDSTVQSLPPKLCEEFPASHTKGKQAAMLRLQAIFDLTNMVWLYFFIGSFRDNDQSQSKLIEKVVQKNDLLLRDLGYFTLNSLQLFIKNQYVITKWDNKTNLYYDQTCSEYQKGEKIDLLKLFKGKTKVDIDVQVGSKKRLSMRLVAKKLPIPIAIGTQAKARIEAAKKDRHSKSNHSKEYYKLLEWEIYLTNVEEDKLSVEQIAKLYSLRWYIEILFKSWKSYANFKKMLGKEKMNYTRLMITIYLLLIQFVYFMLDIFSYISKKVAEQTDRLISILKFMDVVGDLFGYIIRIQKLSDLDNLIPQFVAHATYERRNKRTNMMQKCLFFNDLCDFSFSP